MQNPVRTTRTSTRQLIGIYFGVGIGLGAALGLSIGLTIASPAAPAKAETPAAAAKTEAPKPKTGPEAGPGNLDGKPLTAPVQGQVDYLLSNWQSTQNSEFGYLADSDCVNFASQGLLARGWQMDDQWWYSKDEEGYIDHAKAWVSSTLFRDYLAAHPDRATQLTDAQRSQVKVGDIVQFDWDNSGDRDHTGTVTRVEQGKDGGITIYFAGHTDPTDFRSVDESIGEMHPGASVYYWSIV
ncbi:amidase domain-containing protein [Agromyces humi]|uniref:amidase domain-containing protein n=1 Tax=Agromyces humi TaxID=1766800 RepID=UPI00135AD1E9|nr:amidase domain-containing protein [Agromyces humi]